MDGRVATGFKWTFVLLWEPGVLYLRTRRLRGEVHMVRAADHLGNTLGRVYVIIVFGYHQIIWESVFDEFEVMALPMGSRHRRALAPSIHG